MAVTITIPTAFRQYTEGQSSVALDVETVGAALHGLAERYPALAGHIRGEDGTLRSFVNVYVGDEDIRYLQGEDTPLQGGELVSLIPAIAGG